MLLTQISLLLVFASIFGYISKLFKQPPMIGYLVAGIVISLFGLMPDKANFEVFSKIGITLLLFLVGLEMNTKDLYLVGKNAFWAGLVQMLTSFVLGFFVLHLIGLNTSVSLILSVALSFSSTVVSIKLLSENNDLSSLYGKLAISILLIQDVVAILVLMFLFGNSSLEGNIVLNYLWVLVKAIFIFLLAFFLSKKILPRIFDRFLSGNSELLFVGSLAWALGISSLVAGPLGFSFEIGGLIAGISLSNLHEHLQISSRMRPLRDFFLTIFFLSLGSNLASSSLTAGLLVRGVLVSLFVILSRVLIVLASLGFLGYKKRTSLFTGLSISQISEFSLIIASLAMVKGFISQDQLALIIVVGVITMISSTYFYSYANSIYRILAKFIGFFERKSTFEQVSSMGDLELKNHCVLLGCDRSGRVLVKYLTRKKIPFLVVDFNPLVAKTLSAEGVPFLFGDITDPEILEAACVDNASVVISTVTNLHDNLVLLEYIKRLTKRPLSLLTSENKEEALRLYEAGASYVVVPQAIAGEYIRHLIKTYGTASERIKRIGKGHFSRLIG